MNFFNQNLNMRKFYSLLLILLTVCVWPVAAQQFTDSGFEDWTGETFDGNIQPRYWNFSNVEQLGVKRNFAHQAAGRSGYCLEIRDQFVGVGSIGATSPGYVALGHPWAYVSSLTSVADATAGTYGGLSWSYRPDSIVVWVKRTGSNTHLENFHILYYAWTGTSQGGSYMSKSNGCTDISGSKPQYCVDEESDIRQALDANECGTRVMANQVAEGWYYEMKAYSDWTQLRIPIYYFGDAVPEKCNVILSAGNYPNFRANDGLYDGNTLFVDDISLIYSSKIQKLYIGGREWKGFDPNNTTTPQVYTLGTGATQIPEIKAVRGAGQLSNPHGGRASFSGRQLSAQECVITPGAVDGAPTTITVTAEDGSSTTTYQVQFVSIASNNARLQSIEVDGQALEGFNPYLTTYNVALPYGTTDVPTISATAQDGSATVQVTQAASLPGQATVQVTAGDGTTTQTYTLNLSVAQLSDATLQDIQVDGVSLRGFVPTKSTYTVELPLGTTAAPVVTPVSAYADGVQTIQILTNTLDATAGTGECKIQVTAPSGATRTYTLKYKVTASTNTQLAALYLDGQALADFDPAVTVYTITLPMGTTSLPAITWATGDAYQSVQLTEGGVEGVTRIVVTSAAGTSQTYRLNFTVEKSTNNSLLSILIGGEPIVGYAPEQTEYTITLPAGTKVLPTITWEPGDVYQTVRVVNGGLVSSTRLIVTAGDGSTRTYVLTFEVEKSQSALLQAILLDGDTIAGFDAQTFDYRVLVAGDTVPVISVIKGEDQVVIVSQPQGLGTVRILVQPAEGEANTYTVTLYNALEVVVPEPVIPSYTPGQDAAVEMIYIGEDSLPGFDATVYEYTMVLPVGETQQPTVTATAHDARATIVVTQGEAGADATVRVIAEDSATVQDYRIHFPLTKSSNAIPEDIDVDGRINFDAAQHTYSVTCTQTESYPEVYVTRGEAHQTIVTTAVVSAVGCEVRVDVLAEDSTTATYTIQMTRESRAHNVLRAIYAEHFVLDSVALHAADTLYVDLPYGATSLGISQVVKNYEQQRTVVHDGGVVRPTTIWVYSGFGDTEARRYVLMPRMAQSPLLLTGIQVGGTLLTDYDPEQMDYIVPVTALPVVTATAATGADYEMVEETDKYCRLRAITDDEQGPVYTVWYYYTNDVIPNADFTQSATATYNNGFKPASWQVPADGDDSYSWGLQGAVTTGPEVTRNADGSVHLETWRSKTTNSIYGSIPGMMTLGQLSLNLTSGGGSTSSVSGGIAYRNTPDELRVEVKPISLEKMDNWRVWVNLSGEESLLEGAYSDLGSWRTETLSLSHPEVVTTMNITINSAHSDNANNLGGTTVRRSELDVRRVAFAHSSALTGLQLNGIAATLSGTAFACTLTDAETIGIPAITWGKAVSDQAPAIRWSEETGGVRTATIRNTAEDGTYTDYTLSVTRPLSTVSDYQLAANAPADVWVNTLSPHATVWPSIEGDSIRIRVRAESGAEREGTICVVAYDTLVTRVLGDTTIAGRDSVSTLVVRPEWSDVAELSAILLDGDTIAGFSPYTSAYTCFDENAVNVVGIAGHEQQTIAYEHHALTDGTDLYYIHVRAGNGNRRVYTIRVSHAMPSSDARLIAVMVADSALTGFAPQTQSYTIALSAHSTLPDVRVIPADADATVQVQRVQNNLIITVTAADGVHTMVYTIVFDIPASDYSTLSAILVDGAPLEGFDAAVTDYSLHLPAGTTVLPEIAYVPLESGQTVVVDTTSIANYHGAYTLTVTAEDGVHQTVYTIGFEVDKSSDASLAMIYLDGRELDDFYPDDTDYEVSLPYGAAWPEVSAFTSDSTATWQVKVEDNVYTIQVVAEDGVTRMQYSVVFSHQPSRNALLQMLWLDGDSLLGFQPDQGEYSITLPYGKALPVVTWTAGDEQQRVDTVWAGDVLTINVTAGDGDNTMEYTLRFEHLKSSNNRLRDLRVRGVTVEGFRPDSMEYHMAYPIGSTDQAYFVLADVEAETEDANATCSISMSGTTAEVLVTAADGQMAVYVITQEILLSGEARIATILLDSVALEGFDSDVYDYELILPQGANLPGVSAAMVDTLADYELGLVQDVTLEDGTEVKQQEVYGIAQDGTMLTYTLTYRYANWTPLSTIDEDDYLLYQIPGTADVKAVTIGVGVQLAVYDLNGRCQLLEAVPTAGPGEVEVEIDEHGNQVLKRAAADAAGVVFHARRGEVYLYVFYDSKTKRIAKALKWVIL